ncbi:DNA polymerase III subunit delta [Helicobacter mustelae]|uniref:DNA polymerase III subunit delta n=1 Tax=Helicobacter mustelae TaxID=217 RepID=UPI000DFA8506|nr:DNA polymerase III subunit delta [Helicobacter mustelae]STP13150.1 DNA polymerase III subunit delta [Helicobacter mustelae]
MYKKEFDALLAKSIPQAMLFYGDGFYVDFYTKKILQKMQDANITTLYFSDYQLDSVLDILGQGSLFGGNNVVVLKLDSKLSKKECQILLGCLKENPANALIINFLRSENKTLAQYGQDFRIFASNFQAENAIDVQFFAPSFSEGVGILKERSRELDIDIEDFLLQNLLQIQNGDIAIALGELQKYQIFEEKITLQDLQQLSYGLGSVDMEDFLESLFGREDYLQVYERLQEEGGDGMEVLGFLERYFFILFSFCAYIKSHGFYKAKEILGYQPPDFVAKQYANRAIKIKVKQFREIFEALADWRNAQFRGEKEADIRCLIKIKASL